MAQADVAVRAPKRTAPWEWRRPSAGVSPGQTGIDVFHAYDVNNNAACEPVYGLVESRTAGGRRTLTGSTNLTTIGDLMAQAERARMTLKQLQRLHPDAAIEEVGDRRELVIYT
jgi:hypothetical protein